MTQQADGPSTPSLSGVLAQAGARPIGVAGLRPCYKYPAQRPTSAFGGLGLDASFSDTLFRSATLARQQLALPYEPSCRLAVSQAEWALFSEVGTIRRRAWAAFGQPGGAFEMATPSRFQELSLGTLPRGPFHHGHESWMLDSSLPTGGSVDEFCSVLDPRENAGALDLVEILAATTLEFAAALLSGEELAAAKVVDDTVPAACVYWRREPLEYSVSVTARVRAGHLNGLRFWAVFWSDDEVRGVRWVYKPIEVVAPGLVVARLDQLEPDSEQSGRLMAALWEQFEGLRSAVLRKAETECFSEAVRCLLMV